MLRYMSPEENNSNIRERFPGCMRDRVMYATSASATHRPLTLTKILQLLPKAVVRLAQVRGPVCDGAAGQPTHQSGRPAYRLGIRRGLDAHHDANGRAGARRARRAAHARARLRARRPIGWPAQKTYASASYPRPLS